MTALLTALYGQPGRFSTSFQTRCLLRALKPYFRIKEVEVPGSAGSRLRHLSRLWQNVVRLKLAPPKSDYYLYGNDGFADLRDLPGGRILYWYDAPADWRLEPPPRLNWLDWVRYQNVLNADYVFAVSRVQVEIARDLRRHGSETVIRLPVGVDCARFDPAKASPDRVRQRFCLSPDVPVVGYLGYIAGYAGRFAGQALLEAAPRVLAATPARFLIVGFGPALELFRSEVTARGLEKSFCFTGFVEDDWLPDCIAAMDVCVDTLEPGFHSTARSETKLKQYMAMGGACVATAIGENVHDLDGGRCGILVDPGESSLAQGIVPLLQNDGTRAEFGRLSRLRAQSEFDWTVLGAHVNRVLRRAGGPL